MSSAGKQANGESYVFGPPSHNGRFVVFWSDASNLVQNDTNGTSDVFVRDRLRKSTTRVSVSQHGTQGNDGSFFGVISSDGRFVAFASWASNLVPDGKPVLNIFVRDRLDGTTEQMSVASNGIAANGDSTYPAISPDGRYVAFESNASNLVPHDTNGVRDIFLRDRQAKRTYRVSLGPNYSQSNGPSYGPHLPNNAEVVSFFSDATNLVAGDSNQLKDVFVRDRRVTITRRVSTSQTGVQGNGSSDVNSITPDGRYVVFVSAASNLVPNDTNTLSDIFVYDSQESVINRVSLGVGFSQLPYQNLNPGISADDKNVVFQSTRDPVSIYLRNRSLKSLSLISVGAGGSLANARSDFARISSDSRVIIFRSDASNLIKGDTNDFGDVFSYTSQ